MLLKLGQGASDGKDYHRGERQHKNYAEHFNLSLFEFVHDQFSLWIEQTRMSAENDQPDYRVHSLILYGILPGHIHRSGSVFLRQLGDSLPPRAQGREAL